MAATSSGGSAFADRDLDVTTKNKADSEFKDKKGRTPYTLVEEANT